MNTLKDTLIHKVRAHYEYVGAKPATIQKIEEKLEKASIGEVARIALHVSHLQLIAQRLTK